MNVDEKHLLELAAQDPMEVPNLFGEVKKALVQLEASAPDRLASAVEAFEAKSTHWPEWTWSMRRPHGVYDVRMVGGRYRSWAGEIYSGQRSAKYGVVRGIASPAENWSKPFSLLNLNAAADDLPRLASLHLDKGSLAAKYLKTWREEGFWQRLRHIQLRVKFGAASAKELRKSKLDSLQKLSLHQPQGDAIKELGKATNLDSLIALDVPEVQNAMSASEWEKVSWMRGMRSLTLSGGMTDTLMEAFVDACGLATLEELDLKIQGEAGWLSRLHGLRAVKLWGSVGEDTVRTVLEHNPEVEWLVMLALPIDDDLMVLAEHGTRFKHLDLTGSFSWPSDMDAYPDLRPTWRAMFEAGVLSEVRELRVSHDFDVECAAMLQEYAPKLERLGWYRRSNELFDYVQNDPWLAARAKGQ